MIVDEIPKDPTGTSSREGVTLKFTGGFTDHIWIHMDHVRVPYIGRSWLTKSIRTQFDQEMTMI